MWNDLRHSLRSLIRSPSFTIVAIVTLAVAIGVNTAIFSVLNGVVLRPLAYPDADRLVMVWESNPGQGQQQVQVSAATYLDWRERSRTFETIGAYAYRGFTLNEGSEPVRIASAEVSPAVFRTLAVDAALGRTFTDEDERPGNERFVILSHSSWRTRFGGDSTIVSAAVLLDGESYTVVGVMPEGFRFPPGDSEVEAWSPLTLDREALLSRPHRMYDAIGRLAPDATLGQARQEMNGIAAQVAEENPESNEGWGVTLVPAHEQLVGQIRPTLWILFWAVCLVLLIGCVNVANLLLARSAESERDLAIRASLGAGGWSLIRRSGLDSLWLAALGGLSGLVLAFAGVGFLRSVLPSGIPRAGEIAIDGAVLGFTALASLVAGLVFGFVPALRTLRPDVADILQEGSKGSAGLRTRRMSNLLVGAEVALALVLLVGAGLLIRSFARLTDVDPGFRQEGVVSVAIALPPARYQGSEQQRQFFTQLVEQLRTLPDVDEVGAVSALPMSPLGVDFEIPFTVRGLEAASPSERPRADYRGTIAGYFRAMGVALVSGRLFDRMDGSDGRAVAIVNETLVRRYFPSTDPIGQSIEMPMAGALDIVGVVGDVRHHGLRAEARPEVFVPFTALPLAEMHVVVHSSRSTERMVGLVKEQVLAIDPELPISQAATLEELLATSVAQPRFNMALITALAVSALILAAIGIYGVVSYSVTRRRREIGIRMALGADSRDTVSLIVGQAVRVVAIGALLGIVGSVALSRLIRSLLYGIGPSDALTYLAVGVGLVAIGALAAAIPAARAARVNPVEALRQE